MQTFYVLSNIDYLHNTDSHNFFVNLFYYFNKNWFSFCWTLFKCFKTLNVFFMEVITNDVSWLFMMSIPESNWWCRITFCYISWCFSILKIFLFPYQLYLTPVVIYQMFCTLMIPYSLGQFNFKFDVPPFFQYPTME